jgi:hypothetical protein
MQTTDLSLPGEMQSMTGTMPMEISYSSKKAAVGASFTRAVYLPRSGTSWTAGGIVEIDIPTVKNGYLDTTASFLQFTVTRPTVVQISLLHKWAPLALSMRCRSNMQEHC